MILLLTLGSAGLVNLLLWILVILLIAGVAFYINSTLIPEPPKNLVNIVLIVLLVVALVFAIFRAMGGEGL